MGSPQEYIRIERRKSPGTEHHGELQDCTVREVRGVSKGGWERIGTRSQEPGEQSRILEGRVCPRGGRENDTLSDATKG